MSNSMEKPTCVSLVLCDDVYRDQATQKAILVGTFNNLNATALPCIHPKMVVFFTLTNARGDYKLTLAVEHERTGTEVLAIESRLKLGDPLAMTDFQVVLLNVPFDAEGKYWVTLKVESEIIQQRPFTLTAIDALGAVNKGASHGSN